MNVAVIGTGYVGLVAGACLADLGNKVVCVDVDAEKVKKLKKGINPIYEPGLDEILKRNISKKRLFFTTSISEGIENASVVFIAVGTPQGNDGKADLKYVKTVAEQIGKNLKEEKVIVNKSTVPVGTAEIVKKIIRKHYPGKFHVVSNPEFLREGSAVNDFLKPDRIVVGFEEPKAKKTMASLYKPIKSKKFFTSPKTAELIKYASNCFLATKISFVNEIALLCDKVGADVRDVAIGTGLDTRVNPHFLNAGCGWGGSCFPKDVSALIQIADSYKVNLSIPRAATQLNQKMKKLPVQKLKSLTGSLKGKKIALLGLSFKPNTDDMREASSITIAKELKKQGAIITAFDPVAMENAKKILPFVKMCKNPFEALKKADGAILVTEWPEFSALDFEKAKKVMRFPAIVDGRNYLNNKKLKHMGFKYNAIGVCCNGGN